MSQRNQTVIANPQAEMALLGAIMIDPAQLATVRHQLAPEDFYVESNRQIYICMVSLADRQLPIDFVTLSDELDRRDWMDAVGGPSYIMRIVESTPAGYNAAYYADIVVRKSQLRRLVGTAGHVADMAFRDGDVFEIIQSLERELRQIESRAQNGHGIRHIGNDLQIAVDRIDRAASGNEKRLPTGSKSLDRVLGGLYSGDLIVVAGRPGMGKTNFGLWLALHAAQHHGARVAIFSLEMGGEQLARRMLSMVSAIDGHRLRTGQLNDDEWGALVGAANVLDAMAIYVDDTPGISVDLLRSRARELNADGQLGLIVVDYLQLLRGGNQENRQQEISYISRTLKAIARELDVPVVALSQLSRAVESRADKRPMMSDLRESGAIEQDSDVVLLMYRDDYYHPETDMPNVAEVAVAKHRHGDTGMVKLFFRREIGTFADLEMSRTDLTY